MVLRVWPYRAGLLSSRVSLTEVQKELTSEFDEFVEQHAEKFHDAELNREKRFALVTPVQRQRRVEHRGRPNREWLDSEKTKFEICLEGQTLLRGFASALARGAEPRRRVARD